MSGMKRSRLAAAVAAGMLATVAIVALPGRVGAQVDADVRAGIYPDADAVAVGAGVLTEVGTESGWYFNPNVEVAMGDHRDIVAMSGDFHYDFAHRRNTSVWVGAGPALLVTDREVGDTDTDLGINVLTGVGARRGSVRPFAQLRGTMTNDSQIAVAGGIRF